MADGPIWREQNRLSTAKRNLGYLGNHLLAEIMVAYRRTFDHVEVYDLFCWLILLDIPLRHVGEVHIIVDHIHVVSFCTGFGDLYWSRVISPSLRGKKRSSSMILPVGNGDFPEKLLRNDQNLGSVLSISIYIYLYLSISIYIYLYLSISIYIYLYLSISIYIYLYLSISIYIYVYLSI